MTTPTDAAPAAAEARGGRFTFIDGLRGLAALSVAVHHIFRYGPLAEAANSIVPKWFRELHEYGSIGVPIFFVISGFVIAFTIRQARITPDYVGNFVWRRVIRLDPPYWLTVFGVVGLNGLVLWLVLPVGASAGDATLWQRWAGNFVAMQPGAEVTAATWPQCLLHLVYLQNIFGYENLSVGFWTLCIEVQFYLAFILLTAAVQLLAGGRPRVGAAAETPTPRSLASLLVVFGPLALSSLWLFSNHSDHEPWLTRYFCFFFLCVLAWWHYEGKIPAAIFLSYCVLMAARVGWLAYVEGWSSIYTVKMAVALATGLAIFVLGRRGRLQTSFRWGWLQFLGKISYSLYLTHFPVASIFLSATYMLTGDDPRWALASLVAALGLAIGAGGLFYRLVEAPSVRFSARFKRERSTVR